MLGVRQKPGLRNSSNSNSNTGNDYSTAKASIPTNTTSNANSNSSSSNRFDSLFRAAFLVLLSYYFGNYVGYQQGYMQATREAFQNHASENMNRPQNAVQRDCVTQPPPTKYSTITTPLFTKDTEAFVTAMSSVDRDEFARKFDIGVPLFSSTASNQRVLLLHGKRATPNNASHTNPNTHLSVDEATQNCNYLSLILTEPNRHDQCIAIMGQFNSYHVHKFMRVQEDEVTLNKSLPLQLVKRSTDVRKFRTVTPKLEQTRQFWNKTLTPYLNNLQHYLDLLAPIAQQAATQNTVVVMVCNQGQSELLLNFVCHANSRNLDLSSIIVFATDPETQSLSQSLGLHTFYNELLFQNIPTKHAALFGDKTYGEAIVSKVYCVQLISMLGYDYLFQDVDIVWYKHPLDYFHKELPSELQNFDVYMQNDGNYANFYMPYSGNTGFYYVRNNFKTQHFINQFLVSGDLITATKTHQAPFISVLSEHASLHGLKVKILSGNDFPGGMHYQQQRNYMQYFLGAKKPPFGKKTEDVFDIDPWIFHMSWTLNKDYKIEFFQQMGVWHVADTCWIPSREEKKSKDKQQQKQQKRRRRQLSMITGSSNITQQCCTIEPIIKCHYKDKPSIIPCLDSPTLEKGSKNSFWEQGSTK